MVGGAVVGQLHYRARGEPSPARARADARGVLALELERARGPERASEAAVRDFLDDLFQRKVTDRENIVARGGSWAPTSAPAAA